MAWLSDAEIRHGLIPGGVQLGTAIANAFAVSARRKRQEEERAAAQLGQTTQKLVSMNKTREAGPDLYNRKTTNAFGEEVSVSDARVPADLLPRIDQVAFGDDYDSQQALLREIETASSDSKRERAEAALAEWQRSEEGQKAQQARQALIPTISTLSQIGAAGGEAGAAAAQIQQLATDPSAPEAFRQQALSLVPELQDEFQVQSDQQRVAGLLQAKQEAMERGQAGLVAQIDAELADYQGGLDDASVLAQIQGTLPQGHPKALPVHPLFGGTGILQAMEQQQLLERPFVDQYQAVLELSGQQPQRGVPAPMEEQAFASIAGQVTGPDRVEALRQFAMEREAGGNAFTFADKAKGANGGRMARNDIAKVIDAELRPQAAESKTAFRFRPNSAKRNSWGVYDQARNTVGDAELTPAQRDFVGAAAMHLSSSPGLIQDLGPLVRIVKARSPADAMRVMRDMNLTPVEQKAMASLLSAYGVDPATSPVADAASEAARSKKAREEEDKKAQLERASMLDMARASLQTFGDIAGRAVEDAGTVKRFLQGAFGPQFIDPAQAAPVAPVAPEDIMRSVPADAVSTLGAPPPARRLPDAPPSFR